MHAKEVKKEYQYVHACEASQAVRNEFINLGFWEQECRGFFVLPFCDGLNSNLTPSIPIGSCHQVSGFFQV
jgi:hypothetical protein